MAGQFVKGWLEIVPEAEAPKPPGVVMPPIYIPPEIQHPIVIPEPPLSPTHPIVIPPGLPGFPAHPIQLPPLEIGGGAPPPHVDASPPGEQPSVEHPIVIPPPPQLPQIPNISALVVVHNPVTKQNALVVLDDKLNIAKVIPLPSAGQPLPPQAGPKK